MNPSVPPASNSGETSHEHHVDVGSAPPVRPASTGWMVTIGVVFAVLLGALALHAFLPRRAVSKELATEVAGEDAPPVVQVAAVHRGAGGGTITLPGTIEALHESAIYARVSGYVKAWHFDIGTIVQRGAVLAEIDAPELTQQVQQAQHQLTQARASLGLARADLARWKQLAADSAVTREEFDQKQAAFDAAVADTGGSVANVQRLVDMEGFARVTAPLTGVVTARNIDVGSLITAAGATSAPVAGGDAAGAPGAGSLFRIAQTDTVRLFIPVPESYAMTMNTGLSARVTVQEIPGRTFVGHVVRTSHAIDAASRTLLTEVDIANPGFVLLPGMYAQMQLDLPRTTPPLVIPATSLVIRANGTEVMVLDSAGTRATIHLMPVQVGRDYGASVEILGGITDGTLVVTNPSADLADGASVTVAAPIADHAAAATPKSAAVSGSPPPAGKPKD